MAEDAATGCWIVLDNQSSTTHTGIPAGDNFYGYKATPTTPCTGLYVADTLSKTPTLHLVPNFKTVKGVT